MQDSISYKLCSGCNKVKPVTEFHKARTTSDGLYSHCKWCKGADGRKWRKIKYQSEEETASKALELGFKTCTKCNTEKSVEEFHYSIRSSQGYDKWCQACRSAYLRDRYKANPRDAQIARERYLKTAYSMTVEQYNALLHVQSGLCASCGNEETAFDERTNSFRQLAIDHDHETGKIRGLLCRGCNQALGLLREDPERIQALLAYCVKHKSR